MSLLIGLHVLYECWLPTLHWITTHTRPIPAHNTTVYTDLLHVSSHTNVEVLSHGHVILGILPRYLYHIVLVNMSLVNLISGLLISFKTPLWRHMSCLGLVLVPITTPGKHDALDQSVYRIIGTFYRCLYKTKNISLELLLYESSA